MTRELDAQGGARGERSGPARRVGPLVIVAVVLVGLAVTATVALFPHRAERPLPGTRLHAVRVWNAFASQCQLENGSSPPLTFPCGASVVTGVFRTPDATTRPLVPVQAVAYGGVRACVVDESTLETVLCRDGYIEWIAIDHDVVSAMFLARNGRAYGPGYEVMQYRLSDGATATQRIGSLQWFDRRSTHRVFVVDGERRFRIDFGVLTFVGETTLQQVTD